MLKQFHCSNSSPKPSMPLLQAEQTLGTVLLDISSMHAVCQQSITGLDSIVEQALHAHLRAQSSSQQNLGQSKKCMRDCKQHASLMAPNTISIACYTLSSQQRLV